MNSISLFLCRGKNANLLNCLWAFGNGIHCIVVKRHFRSRKLHAWKYLVPFISDKQTISLRKWFRWTFQWLALMIGAFVKCEHLCGKHHGKCLFPQKTSPYFFAKWLMFAPTRIMLLTSINCLRSVKFLKRYPLSSTLKKQYTLAEALNFQRQYRHRIHFIKSKLNDSRLIKKTVKRWSSGLKLW